MDHISMQYRQKRPRANLTNLKSNKLLCRPWLFKLFINWVLENILNVIIHQKMKDVPTTAHVPFIQWNLITCYNYAVLELW